MRDAAHPQGALSSHQVDMLRMLYGAQTAQVIYVAAKLGVADLLTDGPRTSTELAGAAGVDESVLRRVLRGLVSLGLCLEIEGDRFALTEMGQYLRSDRSDSLRPRAMFGEVLDLLENGSGMHSCSDPKTRDAGWRRRQEEHPRWARGYLRPSRHTSGWRRC